MDIPEATEALRPGEKYTFLSHDLAKDGLTKEQLGKPQADGVVVNYRGVDIISVETGHATFEWRAGGYVSTSTLSSMINKIEARLSPGLKERPSLRI